MPDLKPGGRLKSAACTTEVIIVKTPAASLNVTCGGHPMVAATENPEKIAPKPGLDTGSALGKRYVNSDESLEILCTKAGAGTLGIDDDPLGLKEAKPLPASD